MIPFDHSFDGRPGVPRAIADRVVCLTADNPGPMTFTGTNSFIVGGTVGPVAVIDPGPAEAEAHLTALLDAIGRREVRAVLLTHRHPDHAGLAADLARAVGAPIAAAPSPILEDTFSAEGTTSLKVQADLILEHDQLLSGPDWTLRVLATPGHTADHLSFVLEEEQALFCGDHVMAWSTPVIAPPDGDMGDYLRSLDAVIAADFRTLWPAHGNAIADPAPLLHAYRDHRLRREAQVLDRLRVGDRVAEAMVPFLYAQVSRALWPAAARSVQAHLIKLERDGLALRDPDGGYRPR